MAKDKLVELTSTFNAARYLQSIGITYKEFLDEMKEIKGDIGAQICNCGTNKDALDVTANAVAHMLEHDCAKWNHLAMALQSALYRNARLVASAAKAQKSHGLAKLMGVDSYFDPDATMYDIDLDIFLAHVHARALIECNKEAIDDKIENVLLPALRRKVGDAI